MKRSADSQLTKEDLDQEEEYVDDSKTWKEANAKELKKRTYGPFSFHFALHVFLFWRCRFVKARRSHTGETKVMPKLSLGPLPLPVSCSLLFVCRHLCLLFSFHIFV